MSWKRLALAALFGGVTFACAPSTRAQFLLPLRSPETKAAQVVMESHARFFRRDDGPRYAMDARPDLIKMLDVSKRDMHRDLDAFASVAHRLQCRTDDMANAEQFAFEIAMLTYGKRIPGTTQTSLLACAFAPNDRTPSFTDFMVMDQLNTRLHLAIGGNPLTQRMSDFDKQLFYEEYIVRGMQIGDDLVAPRGDHKHLDSARKRAAAVILRVTGVRPQRVNYSPDGGIEISDQ